MKGSVAAHLLPIWTPLSFWVTLMLVWQGIENMAQCRPETYAWKGEFQWSHAIKILHRISALYHRYNVPSKRLLEEHMATPTLKALASTRPCTIQQVRKTICYSDQSQSRTKLL